MTPTASTAVDICKQTDHSDLASPTIVLVYKGSSYADLETELVQARVTDPLVTAFTVVRNQWDALVAAGDAGRVVVVAPAAAALGDPDRPFDSAVVGALISFVRSVAIELQKSGGSANTVLFEENISDRKCQDLIDVLIHKSGIATGQEIFVTDGLHLGRLHP
jgi:hypothetical protein